MAHYLRYNIIMSWTMSMYKINPKSTLFKKILWNFWRFICNLGFISGITLSLLNIIYKQDKGIDKIAIEVMNSVIFFSSIIRINYFYLREDKLKKLVDLINETFKRQTETGFEEKNIQGYDKFNQILVLIWSFSVFFTGQFMALLPLFFIYKTGRVLPLPLYYPYDWKTSPGYEITYFTQVLTQYFMGFSYGSSDMFFVCTVFMITSQFEFLGLELENIMFTTLLNQKAPTNTVKAFQSDLFRKTYIDEEMSEIIRSKKFTADLNQGLNRWINYHQAMLKVCDETQDFFSLLLLPNMLLSISYGIFIMYSLVISKPNSSISISLIEYIIIHHVQIFCLTFMGQKLNSESESLLNSLYNIPWYLCDKDTQRTLNIIQIKLSKPTVMTAWKFFPMTLTTFVFAIKTSFSYLAFLRQVTE